MRRILYITLLAAMSACLSGATKKSTAAKQHHTPKRYSYIVERVYPHSTTSYTQGLQFIDGQLWEGSGEYGSSRLMKVDLTSGTAQTIATLPASDFGEGITILGDTIYQLTWREGHCYLYSRQSGKRIDTKKYSGEGWGLTSDGEQLYMSDGTPNIAIRKKDSFEVVNNIEVRLEGNPLPMINELEWINGQIWANIYCSDSIVIINPLSGEVEGLVDLTGLLPTSEHKPTTDVLNGIAYDSHGDRLFVTGKNWSKLFKIKIIER